MADLNEPKKETVRITLPPSTPPRPTEKETARINLPNRPPGPRGGAKPPTTDLRPPSSPPKPLPPAGAAWSPRPLAPSKVANPASTLNPPLPPSPRGLKAPVPPPPPPGLESSAPTPAASVAATPPKPVFPSVNPPLENHGTAQTRPRKRTVRIAESPMKATVKLGSVQPVSVPASPFVRHAPPGVANPSPPRFLETIPTQLCWVVLGISALILLIQLWTYFA